MKGTCSVEECEQPHSCKGYCKLHYARWRRHGNPLNEGVRRGKPRKYHTRVCSIDGCGRERNGGRGMCAGHYMSLRIYGDPMVARRRDPDAWCRTPDGYLVKMIDGRMHRQHRYVMEQSLGRELLPHENVHHINGDRADNRIENLELWTKSQPPGQRVSDKVLWAIELLGTYAPTALSDKPFQLEL